MNRFWVGVMAISALAISEVATRWVAPDSTFHALGASSLRLAILLGVVWLAAPDIQRLPPWTGLAIVGVVVALYFAARYIRYVLWFVAVFAIGALILRPRRRPPAQRR
jgi:hypothetical protein